MDVHDLHAALQGVGRPFFINGDDIDILDTPSDYYQALMDGLARSRRRATIASLYIGTGGGREREFASALRCALSSTPGLQVSVLLDALRSTRPSKDEAGDLTSTALMLQASLMAGGLAPGANARVSLYHTPALRGLLKRVLPPRVSEAVGVCHLKAYIFDDDVLISGANLSSTYFTNRQDRAWLLRGAADLAALLNSAVDAVADHSYQLLPPTPLPPLPPFFPPTVRGGGGGEGATAAAAAAAGGGGGGGGGGVAAQVGAVGEATAVRGGGGRGSDAGCGSSSNGAARSSSSNDAACSSSSGGGGSSSDVWSDGGPGGPAEEGAAAAAAAAFAIHTPRHLHRVESRQQHAQQQWPPPYLGPIPAGSDPVMHPAAFQRSLVAALRRLFDPRQEDPATAANAAADARLGTYAGAETYAGAAASTAGARQAEAASSGSSSSGDGDDFWGSTASGRGGEGCGSRSSGNSSSSSSSSSDGGGDGGSSSGSNGDNGGGDVGGIPVDWKVDTMIVPTVQMGAMGLRQDEVATLRFMRAAAPGGTLHLSTAYLNLARPFERCLAALPGVNLRLITAAPEANGFFGAKGLSGHIPAAYALLAHRAWRRLCRPLGPRSDLSPAEPSREQSERTATAATAAATCPSSSATAGHAGQPPPSTNASPGAATKEETGGAAAATAVVRGVWEYHRPGWEFHAKGLWYTPPGERHPIASAVGSPNYGSRSLSRDLEAQLFVVTTSPSLRERLGREAKALEAHCEPMAEARLAERSRDAAHTARLAARLLRRFL